MHLQSVESSSIDAVAYVPERHELIVHFREHRRTYVYENVSAAEYRALLAAPSKGRFVNQRIKPYHHFRSLPCTLVSGPYHKRS